MVKTILFNLLLTFSVSFANAADSVHGVLRVVKGDVQIKSAKDGKSIRARLGEKVFPQDTVITGKDARVKIVMTDNNEINISPDSQMVIQNYVYNPEKGQKDVLLNVIYGKVRSKVEQTYDGKTTKFQVKTPSAVAGVRGTDFMTSFNNKNGSTQVVTFHGKVEFGVPGPNGVINSPVMVQPGQMSSLAAGQTPQTPSAMPKEQLAKTDMDSKADDRVPAAQQTPGKEDTKSEKKDDSSKNETQKSEAKEAKQEAKQEPKQESKQEPKQEAKQSGTAASSSGSGGSMPTMREPASAMPKGSMLGADDLPSTNGGDKFRGSIGSYQPVLPPINQLPRCDFCNTVIQDGLQKITIKVQTQ